MRPFLFAAALIFLTSCVGTRAPEPAAQPEPANVSRPVAAAGEMCGGIAGIACTEGLSCIFEDTACHQTADVAGTCQKTPTICTREYMPVCGCNGETYGNRCEALAAGASVAFKGKCPPAGS